VSSDTNLFRRYPVALFYLLAFAISWLGWIPKVAYARGESAFTSPLFVFLAGAGPAIAAAIVMFALKGRAGLDELFAALTRWRVSWTWYLVALFGGAIITLASVGLGSLFGLSTTGLAAAIPYGALPGLFLFILLTVVWEELGWRGFALPRLQARYNALITSLIVGLLWALWHLPNAWDPTIAFSQVPFWLYALERILLSVIFTWLVNNALGSVLLAGLFHASDNVFGTLPVAAGIDVMQYFLIRTVTVGVIALLLVVAFGPAHLSRKPDPVSGLEVAS